MSEPTVTYEAWGNLYLNITNQCSADCVFCVRSVSDGVYGFDLRLSTDPPEKDILVHLERMDLCKYQEVVFTGFGEPTCRFDTVLTLTTYLKEKSRHVRLDTNGHAALINPGRDVVAELKSAGLGALSVSLNAESEEKYDRLCRPKFKGAYQALLQFTKNAVEAGIPARMTVVGKQDIDIKDCEKIAFSLGASFKVR